MLLLAGIMLLPATADDAKKKDEEKFSAVCTVSGKAAKEDQHTEYLEGKCYFCCGNCKKAFDEAKESDTNKFAVKANHQLAATGQYVQKACPLSGGKLKSEPSKVGSEKNTVDVAFCCNNCKKKVDDAEGDEQLSLVFSEKAFEKSFEKKKDKE